MSFAITDDGHGSGYLIRLPQNLLTLRFAGYRFQSETLRATSLPLGRALPLRRQEHSFFQVPSNVSVRSRVRIVGDHYNGFVKIFI